MVICSKISIVASDCVGVDVSLCDTIPNDAYSVSVDSGHWMSLWKRKVIESVDDDGWIRFDCSIFEQQGLRENWVQFFFRNILAMKKLDTTKYYVKLFNFA